MIKYEMRHRMNPCLCLKIKKARPEIKARLNAGGNVSRTTISAVRRARLLDVYRPISSVMDLSPVSLTRIDQLSSTKAAAGSLIFGPFFSCHLRCHCFILVWRKVS